MRGWLAILAILGERLYWSASSYRRQYRLQRRNPAISEHYTVADKHDEDMLLRVLEDWRSSHPLTGVEWVFQKKTRGKSSLAQKIGVIMQK